MIDVRMLCLAALMGGREASGYDIKKDLEKGSQTGLIDASFGSIYPALARLLEEGFITAKGEGGRGRAAKTLYAMTPAGKAYFLKTLSGPIPDEKYRSPFLFAMLFAEDLPRERVRAMIDRQIAAWEEKLEVIRAMATECGGPGERFVTGFGEITLKAGLDFLKRQRRDVENAARPASLSTEDGPESSVTPVPHAAE